MKSKFWISILFLLVSLNPALAQTSSFSVLDSLVRPPDTVNYYVDTSYVRLQVRALTDSLRLINAIGAVIFRADSISSDTTLVLPLPLQPGLNSFVLRAMNAGLADTVSISVFRKRRPLVRALETAIDWQNVGVRDHDDRHLVVRSTVSGPTEQFDSVRIRVRIRKAQNFSVVSDTLFSLKPADSTSVDLRFSPGLEKGDFTDTLFVSMLATQGTLLNVDTVLLRGKGINPRPNYAVNGNFIFDAMQDGYLSSPRNIRIINEGADSLVIDRVSINNTLFQSLALLDTLRIAPDSQTAVFRVVLRPDLGWKLDRGDTTVTVRLVVESHYPGDGNPPRSYTDTLDFSVTLYQPSLIAPASFIFQDSAHVYILADSARGDLALAVGGVASADTSARLILKNVSIVGSTAGFVIHDKALLEGSTLHYGTGGSILLAFRQNMKGDFVERLRLVYALTETLDDTLDIQIVATMLAAVVSVSATDQIDFDRVGFSKTVDVIYKNVGNCPLELHLSLSAGDRGFSIDTSVVVIAVADSVVRNIVFMSDSSGIYRDTLLVRYDDAQVTDGIRSLKIGLVVNVLSVPVLLTTQVDFGRVQDGFNSEWRLIQIDNRNDINLVIDSIVSSDGSVASFAYNAGSLIPPSVSNMVVKLWPDLRRKLPQDSLLIQMPMRIYLHYENYNVYVEKLLPFEAMVFQPGIRLLGRPDFSDSAFVYVPADSARHSLSLLLDGVYPGDSANVRILGVQILEPQRGFSIGNRDMLEGQLLRSSETKSTNLSFRRDSLGDYGATLQVTAQVTTTVIDTFRIDLRACMLAAVLELSAPGIEMGTVAMDDSASGRVYLRNRGNWHSEFFPMQLVFKNGTMGFSVDPAILTASIAPGDSLGLRIVIHPRVRDLNSDTLIVDYRDAGIGGSAVRTNLLDLKAFTVELFVIGAALTTENDKLLLIVRLKPYFDYDETSITASDFQVGFLDSTRLAASSLAFTDSTVTVDLDQHKIAINKAIKAFSPGSRPPQSFLLLKVKEKAVRLKPRTETDYHTNDEQQVPAVSLGNLDPWAAELTAQQAGLIFSPGPTRNRYDSFRKRTTTITVPVRSPGAPGLSLTASLFRKVGEDLLQSMGPLAVTTVSNLLTWNGQSSGTSLSDGIYTIQIVVVDPAYSDRNSFPLLYEVVIDNTVPSMNFNLSAPDPVEIPDQLRPAGMQENVRLVKHTESFRLIGPGEVEDNVCVSSAGVTVGTEVLSFPVAMVADSLKLVLIARDLLGGGLRELGFEITANPQGCGGLLKTESDSTLFSFDRLMSLLGLSGEEARVSLEGMYLLDQAGNAAEVAFRTRSGLMPLSPESPLVYWIYIGDSFDWLLERTFVNYPNPFSPRAGQRTTISYMLAKETNVNSGDILVFTDTGELVSRIPLSADDLRQNVHEIVWDGRDFMSQPLGRGIYFAVLKLAGTQKRVLKIAIY